MPAPWMGRTEGIFPGRAGHAHTSTFLPKTSSRPGDVPIRDAAQVHRALSRPPGAGLPGHSFFAILCPHNLAAMPRSYVDAMTCSQCTPRVPPPGSGAP